MDCAAEVRRATLNGVELDPASRRRGTAPAARPGRRQRPRGRLAAQSDTATGAGILRTVDPTDKLVYVWTSFEPDDARRLWACFDQPDLKAAHAVHRVRPPRPGRSPATPAPRVDGARPTAGGSGRFAGHATAVDVRRGGQRRPFYELAPRAGRARPRALLPPVAAPRTSSATPTSCSSSPQPGPGLLRRAVRRGRSRRSATTRSSCPNMGGAMENWGCVTWRRRRAVPQRAHPRAAVERRAYGPAARDGAHVVRRPGDHALVGRPVAQRGVRLVGRHLGGRRARPSYTDKWATLPRRGEARRATASTWAPATPPDPRGGRRRRAGDGRTSTRSPTPRGRASCKQLVAYVGEDAFVAGLRALLPRPRLGQHPPRRPDVGASARRPAATSRPGSPRGSTAAGTDTLDA